MAGCRFQCPFCNPLSLSGLFHSAFALDQGVNSSIEIAQELGSLRRRDVVPIDDAHGGGGEKTIFGNLGFDVDRRPLGDAILGRSARLRTGIADKPSAVSSRIGRNEERYFRLPSDHAFFAAEVDYGEV